MGKPHRSADWYSEKALEAAKRSHDPALRENHLRFAWHARMVTIQKTPFATIHGLQRCCYEGVELLGDPSFETMARHLAQVADSLERLKRTRGSNRLFILADESAAVPRFTLRHIEPYPTPTDRYYYSPRSSEPDVPHSPFDVQLTANEAIIRVVRTREITSLGDAGTDADLTTAQIARLPLVWKLAPPEDESAPAEPWIGRLIVGRRAIDAWTANEHDNPLDGAFAERIRALSEDDWPVVTYQTRGQ